MRLTFTTVDDENDDRKLPSAAAKLLTVAGGDEDATVFLQSYIAAMSRICAVALICDIRYLRRVYSQCYDSTLITWARAGL